MTGPGSHEYPPHAYASHGVLWWDLLHWPGTRKRIGDEVRIAAWLASNKGIGDLFTTDELREALGSGGERNTKEHFQRRIRELRSKRYGWELPSAKYEHGLPQGSYRVDLVGWHPALGPKPSAETTVSAATRRRVLERDYGRCFFCGIAAKEPYPDDPLRSAVMTVGHVVPAELGGSGTDSNLRAECSRCNESSRSSTLPPESLESVEIDVRQLTQTERKQFLEWAASGRRERSRVDAAFDRYRHLTPGDQADLVARLRSSVR